MAQAPFKLSEYPGAQIVVHPAGMAGVGVGRAHAAGLGGEEDVSLRADATWGLRGQPGHGEASTSPRTQAVFSPGAELGRGPGSLSRDLFPRDPASPSMATTVTSAVNLY